MNSNSIFIAEELGTDLSSRRRAVVLRERIHKILESGNSAVGLNFDGVRTLSDSFADELFGVLVLSHGTEWFRQHLSLAGLTADVRLTILSVIQSRLEGQATADSTSEINS